MPVIARCVFGQRLVAPRADFGDDRGNVARDPGIALAPIIHHGGKGRGKPLHHWNEGVASGGLGPQGQLAEGVDQGTKARAVGLERGAVDDEPAPKRA